MQPFSYDILDQATDWFIIFEVLSQSRIIFNPKPARQVMALMSVVQSYALKKKENHHPSPHEAPE